MKSGRPDGAPPFRVLLIGADPAFTRHLTQALAGSCDFRVAAHMPNVAAAAAALATEKPDLVIVDIDADRPGSFEFFQKFTTAAPDLKILAVCSSCDPAQAEQVFIHGVRGLLLKSDTPDELVSACSSVINGQMCASRTLTMPLLKRLLSNTSDGAVRGPESLTDREWRVFELLGLGLSTREVAARLGLSCKTVNNHLAKIQHRLGFTSAEALAQYAFARLQMGNRTGEPSLPNNITPNNSRKKADSP